MKALPREAQSLRLHENHSSATTHNTLATLALLGALGVEILTPDTRSDYAIAIGASAIPRLRVTLPN